MKVAFLFAIFLSFSFAQIDSIFVPPKPAKPLRFCSATKKWIEYATNDSNLVEITHLKGLQMDLRYATFDNISGHDLYCGNKRAFLHKEAAQKLQLALNVLAKKLPGYTLVIFDAARPLYAQEALRKTVRGTAYSTFVSAPSTGSLHNFGLAIDLGLADSQGNLLDMGADFDSFEKAAGEAYEAEALKNGRLTQEQINNRNKLRDIMKSSGWISLKSEWWHFNAYPSKIVRKNYTKFPL